MMDEKIKEQIEAIRKTGETNMFDVNAVCKIAFDKGFFELVVFITGEKTQYVDFILHGDKK